MKSGSYEITGGDYARAGAASGAIKDLLKKIGAEPAAIRRASIAAYEAEMNVVIHAWRGTMRFALNAGRLELDVDDEGPGIPDIDKAMQEGFSTAPPSARALGFGAGMGLPNIRRNCDEFSVTSVVGKGTHLKMGIVFARSDSAESKKHGLTIAADRCRECRHCLFACPTRALRMRGEGPKIMEHLCIDCTACLAACARDVFSLETGLVTTPPRLNKTLVVPQGFLVQFGMDISIEQVYATLAGMGVEDVIVLEGWENALRDATADHAKTVRRHPVIAPLCPAVVNLIEVRFPSLIPNVAQFLTPMEAAHHDLVRRETTYVVACPGQRSVLMTGRVPVENEIITVSALSQLLFTRLHADRRKAARAKNLAANAAALDPSAALEHCRPVGVPAQSLLPLRVKGLSQVFSILEEVERGLLQDVAVLELYGCAQGCFGSPLYKETPALARYRWMQSHPTGSRQVPPRAVPRKAPYLSRSGLRLDADMTQAILKLSQIDEWNRTLPGRDCGLCGAPSCSAMAEDIVLGRSCSPLCLHRNPVEDERK